MDVKLVVLEGKNAGQKVPVPGGKFFIGRGADCQLRPQSDQVSRHHAVILAEDGFVAVRDLGSRGGTFVNGQRVKTEQELKNGDQLRLGPLNFELELAVEIGGKKKPKVHSVSEAAARAVEAADGEDLDIFDLLGEQQEAPAVEAAVEAAASNSQTAQAHAQETVAAAQPGEEQPEQEPKEERKEKKKDRKEKKKGGIVGKFSSQTKPAAGSSRSAAEDMLRKFMSR